MAFTSHLGVQGLTVFPAPSKPNINTPNSSLRVRYSYRPLSRLYMEDSQRGGEQVVGGALGFPPVLQEPLSLCNTYLPHRFVCLPPAPAELVSS